VRVVSLAQPRSLGISIVPAIFLCLKKLVRTSTPAPGLVVPVNVNALSTPISVLFGEPVRTELNQVLAVVWSLFRPYSMDVEAVLHLRIFFVSRVKK
jgi:hypothetical protein